MADRTYFSIRPIADARPLDSETTKRIARTAGADVSDVDEDGVACLGFDAAHDAATARGNLQMAARVELGAHWQTRYQLHAS